MTSQAVCSAAMSSPRHQALEAVILADPEDPAGYLVYGDHLQSVADPRGELIAVQAARTADAASTELRAAELALLEAHRAAWFGADAPLPHVHVDWFHGFWRSLDVGSLGHIPGPPLDGQVAQLVASPSARFVRELHCRGPFTARVLELAEPLAATLRVLEVAVHPHGSFVDDDLLALAPLTRLRRLHLFSCEPITCEGVAVLGNLRELAELDLRNCRLTDAIAHELVHLPLSDVSFNAVAPTFTADGMRALATAPLRRLALELTDRNTEGASDALVAPLAAHPTLVNLELDAAQLTATGMRTLGGISRLRRLVLASSGLAGRDVAMLTSLAGGLESLHLGHSSGVTDAACDALAGFERLAFLDVGATAIAGAGLRSLARIRSLVHLDLSFLALEDADIAVLADLPELRSLSLAYTRLTDRAIDTLVQLPRLEKLDLSSTKITPAAIDRLAELPALIELGLSDCESDTIERAYQRPQWYVGARELIELHDELDDVR